MFFPGFTLEQIHVTGGRIRLRHAGSGPPLLLLHGNPQSHAMWHAVAPELAKRFTVICADLRGYGGSLKPPATPDHAPYAKKPMALDMVEVMEHFGHRRFSIGSHDRGARVAHRLALDFPGSGREAGGARHRADHRVRTVAMSQPRRSIPASSKLGIAWSESRQ
jgi:haloacetate dehalogenase